MSSNKTIAKNTLYLYIRMLFNMGVTLYSSRVVLQVLGVEDFGIYNLVAGIVVLFSFLDNSMTAATQRYINVEKVSRDTRRINKIFNISLLNHLLIGVVVFILSETIGLWFLNNYLNIPADRMYAANVLYQFSILSTFIGICRIPFNSMIVAYEKMSFIAVVGIFEALSKLSIALFLLYGGYNGDLLLLYGGLFLLVSFLTFFIYVWFNRWQFKNETKIKYYKDFEKSKELFVFSGWILFGQVAVVGSNQGINVLLNVFYGVALNASMGLANQVNSAVYSFVSNFQTAFNPQIVQTYALGEKVRNKKLILAASKYSFFLLAIISAPVLLYTESILTIWLGKNLPNHLVSLVKVIVFVSLIDALAGPFWMAAGAIGSQSVKAYNISLTLINLLTLPIAYVLLKNGLSPVYAIVAKLMTGLAMQMFRYYFINKYLRFEMSSFISYLIRVLVLLGLLIVLVSKSKQEVIISFYDLLVRTVVLMIGVLVFIYLFGLNKTEKNLTLYYLKNRLRKI